MGNAIWVQVLEDGEASGGDRDNSIMLRMEKDLDQLAERLGVKKLSSFFDYTVLEAAFADVLAEADPGGKPTKPRWSSARVGLRSVAAILEELRRRPTALKFKPDPSRKHWPALLLEELEHCHETLELAVYQKQKFRFLIVP